MDDRLAFDGRWRRRVGVHGLKAEVVVEALVLCVGGANVRGKDQSAGKRSCLYREDLPFNDPSSPTSRPLSLSLWPC